MNFKKKCDSVSSLKKSRDGERFKLRYEYPEMRMREPERKSPSFNEEREREEREKRKPFANEVTSAVGRGSD